MQNLANVDIEICFADVSHTQAIANFQYDMALETENLQLDITVTSDAIRAFLEARGTPQDCLGFYVLAVEKTERSPIACLMITYASNVYASGTAGEWWYQSVFVKREYRGQKVFKSLFTFVEDLNKEQRFPLKLYVEQENQRAQGVYQRLGMSDEKSIFLEHDFVFGKNKIDFKLSIGYSFENVHEVAILQKSLSEGQSIFGRALEQNHENEQQLDVALRQGRYFIIKKDGVTIGAIFGFLEFTDWRHGLIFYTYDIRLNTTTEDSQPIEEIYCTFVHYLRHTHQDKLPVKCVRIYINEGQNQIIQRFQSIGLEKCHYRIYAK